MAAQRKYPEELRDRAVKLVLEVREREGSGRGEIARVGRQLDVHPEALRGWLKQAEIDGGQRPGTTAVDNKRITELERESPASCAAQMGRSSRPLPKRVFRAGTRPEAAALVEFVDAHRARFGIEPVCAVLEFPVSSYYFAKKREDEPTARETRDVVLKDMIMEVWKGEKGRGVYGGAEGREVAGAEPGRRGGGALHGGAADARPGDQRRPGPPEEAAYYGARRSCGPAV